MDVRLPDGTVINNVPEGTTKAELTAKLTAKGYNLPIDNAPVQPQVEQPKSYSTLGALGTGAMNLIPSTGKLIGGAYQAVRHPVNTMESLIQATSGGLSKVLPESIMQYAVPEKRQKAEQLANALGEDYSKKYGSYEGFKTAFAEDPASILADASTVLTGGGAALKAGGLTKAADVVNQAAKFSNPLYLGAKAVQGAAYIPSHLTKGTLGVTTGVALTCVFITPP
jgi:hypothetical protein